MRILPQPKGTEDTVSNVDPGGNPLYARGEDLHPSHWELLADRPRAEVIDATGAMSDGNGYVLTLLGKSLAIDPGLRRVAFVEEPERPVSYQRALVVVAYLGHGMEVPRAERWVAFRELPGGEAFFRGPHSLATPRLEAGYGGAPEALSRAGIRLGGTPCEGADVGVEIPALPKIPIRVLLWGRTDEFQASAQLLTDARAYLHLPLDVLWALTNLTLSDLVKDGAPWNES